MMLTVLDRFLHASYKTPLKFFSLVHLLMIDGQHKRAGEQWDLAYRRYTYTELTKFSLYRLPSTRRSPSNTVNIACFLLECLHISESRQLNYTSCRNVT